MRLEHLLSGALQGFFLGQGDAGGVLLTVEVISITRQVAGEKDEAVQRKTDSPGLSASPIAQLVRAPH